MRTYQSKFAFKNATNKFYFFCAILITTLSSVNAQVCESGEAVASNSIICSGTNTTISVIVPKGSIAWQQSSDGINWINVSSGSSVTNITPASTEVKNFSYTGSEQTFIVPRGVTSIIASGYGAAGGHGSSDFNGRGGLGGSLEATLSTTPEETLSIYIGEQGHNTIGNPGTNSQPDNQWIGSDGLGGFNGGGNATSGSGGGGGSTDIRQNGNTLSDRIFVVGSGGGGGNQRRNSDSGGNGGNGGGLTGATGVNGGPDIYGNSGGIGGGGGSQLAGGSASGGNGATSGSLGQGGLGATTSRTGGGGGGGYYGGGGGGHKSDRSGGGGGGGSSFTTGTITTNVQGDTAATGNGSLTLSFTVPEFVESIYTTPNLTANTYYRAVVTDVSCTENYSLPSLITVNPLPIPTFTAQPDDIVIDSEVSYTTQSGQSNYVWTIPGIVNTDYSISSGGTSSDNTVVLKWLNMGSKAIQINYTNSNNCVGATATSSNSINVRNYGITKNGLKISNPANSINQYGAIGTGKSVSIYGEIMDTPNSLITSGLIMHLDAGSTSSYSGTGNNWSDISGNGNHGTLVNGVTYNSANSGSLVFDGLNDYFVTNNNLNLSDTDKLTVQIILKTATTNGKMIMEHSIDWNSNNAYGVLAADNKMQFTDHNLGYNVRNSVATINDNNWHVLSATTDRSLNATNQTVIYIDGDAPNSVIDPSLANDNSGNFTSHKLYISSRAGTGYYFNGTIAQVLIYNRVLTAEEIQQNYNAVKSKYGL
ncbi:glycine-rich protein [Confluentibacter flavum]|uniref:receptor protein-tyrosine kinase n=1 Tax=Confluentibacter flavum TaxID=1909700 RepID=A0A2N3HK45_9FLAO|nr:glycine-rich protein [Confluentibacter flavum]PKQ45218.1 hypothetical protein CSW08_09390 [Confluentibacter flavum]